MLVELIHRLLHGKRQWATSKPYAVETHHPNGAITVTHVSHGPLPHWPLVIDKGTARRARIEIQEAKR